MKKIFKSMIIGLVLCFVFTLIPFEGECKAISDKVLRIHILANSDSKEDQNLKLKVRDAIVSEGEEILQGVTSKEDAKELVSRNIERFEKVAQNTITENGYTYPVTVELTNMHFNTRYYNNISMPAGFYDALRVKIGNADGKNWWCVMFPSLCIFSVSKTETLEDNLSENQYKIVTSNNDFKFKFKIVEFFSWICDSFS